MTLTAEGIPKVTNSLVASKENESYYSEIRLFLRKTLTNCLLFFLSA
jgi:hypothetical protein